MQIGKIITINFLVFLAVLFFLEVSTRVLGLSNLMGTDKNFVMDGPKGYHVLKPNSVGLVFDKKIFTDSNGYRVPSKNYEYKNKKKIFIIGDSVALGVGVKEQETFVGLMRQSLENYEIYNSSVMGYQIYHLKKAIPNIDNFFPVDKIIYFFTLNDIWSHPTVSNNQPNNQAASEGTNNKIQIIKKYFNPNLIYKINVFLRNKSYFYMFLKGVILDPSKNWFKNVHNFYSHYNGNELNEYLILLKNKANKLQAELYVVILPYEYQTRNCSENNLMPQKMLKKL